RRIPYPGPDGGIHPGGGAGKRAAAEGAPAGRPETAEKISRGPRAPRYGGTEREGSGDDRGAQRTRGEVPPASSQAVRQEGTQREGRDEGEVMTAARRRSTAARRATTRRPARGHRAHSRAHCLKVLRELSSYLDDDLARDLS